MASLKWGIRSPDGTRAGPVDPNRYTDAGWTWYDTKAEMLAAGLPLEPARQAKLIRLISRREEVMDGGFIAAGIQWRSGPKVREKMVLLMASLGAGEGLPGGSSTLTIRDLNNTPRTLNETQIRALVRIARDFFFAVETHAETLEEAIKAAGDKATLDAVNIETGWPT